MFTRPGKTPIDDMYHSMKVIEKGTIAQRELDCWSCETTECCILTTSMVTGGIIGAICIGLPGIIIGIGLGCVGGLILLAIRKYFC